MGKVSFAISPSDLADVLGLMEKRVGTRSKQPGELAYLALLASECAVLMVKKHWPYDEDFEAVMGEMRQMARIDALKMFHDTFGM
jgi:hypothetical protein